MWACRRNRGEMTQNGEGSVVEPMGWQADKLSNTVVETLVLRNKLYLLIHLGQVCHIEIILPETQDNMAANGTEKKPLTIVVGSDNAGHAYKTALKETLSKHAGVTKVLDVGVVEADDKTAYPHLAVDAAKKITSGEVSLLSTTSK